MGLVSVHVLPSRFFAFWLAISAAISFLNALRTLGAHAYESSGRSNEPRRAIIGLYRYTRRDMDGACGRRWVFVTTPCIITFLEFPITTWEAWREFTALLPPGAVYRRVQSRGLARSLAALCRKGWKTRAAEAAD